MGTMPYISKDEESYHFTAPGEKHQARWTAQAIYTLKIGLFHQQFKLTEKEVSAVKNIKKLCDQVLYQALFLSQIAVCAPHVDLELLKILGKDECYQPVL